MTTSTQVLDFDRFRWLKVIRFKIWAGAILTPLSIGSHPSNFDIGCMFVDWCLCGYLAYLLTKRDVRFLLWGFWVMALSAAGHALNLLEAHYGLIAGDSKTVTFMCLEIATALYLLNVRKEMRLQPISF